MYHLGKNKFVFLESAWWWVGGECKHSVAEIHEKVAKIFEIVYVKVDQVTMYYIGSGNW